MVVAAIKVFLNHRVGAGGCRTDGSLGSFIQKQIASNQVDRRKVVASLDGIGFLINDWSINGG